MRYKAILFDNDDTLMDFQAGNRIAVNQLMDELGYFHPDRYEQYQAVNHACWAAPRCGCGGLRGCMTFIPSQEIRWRPRSGS